MLGLDYGIKDWEPSAVTFTNLPFEFHATHCCSNLTKLD